MKEGKISFLLCEKTTIVTMGLLDFNHRGVSSSLLQRTSNAFRMSRMGKDYTTDVLYNTEERIKIRTRFSPH